MNKTSRVFPFSLLTTLLLGVACAAPVVPKLPQWKSPPEWSEKLASPRKYSFGEIRAPKGFTLHQRPIMGKPAYFWVGPEGEDTTRPTFMIVDATLPENEAKKYSAEQFLNLQLQSIKAKRENWQRTAAERGTINGIPFLRVRWSGKHPQAGVDLQGFILVTKSGRNFLQISSQQSQPDDMENLKLTEAAALTFKKK